MWICYVVVIINAKEYSDYFRMTQKGQPHTFCSTTQPILKPNIKFNYV